MHARASSICSADCYLVLLQRTSCADSSVTCAVCLKGFRALCIVHDGFILDKFEYNDCAANVVCTFTMLSVQNIFAGLSPGQKSVSAVQVIQSLVLGGRPCSFVGWLRLST